VYERSAEVYDLVNQAGGKDYAAEAERVAALILARNPDAVTLLDVACGTGIHLGHLRQRFTVSGVEPEPPMRELAARALPGVALHAGDMRSFDLGEQFDAVTCLFSPIGYMLTRHDLDAAMAAMARHVAPGGVLVVEPWFHPEGWIDGFVLAEAANGPGVAVTRASRSWRVGHLSRFEFHFAIARPDAVETFVEPHEAALWEVEEYREAMAATGLTVEHDPVGLTGRGLFIGRRPSTSTG
jgi:SAM-dependent methyltransferase